MRNFISVTQDIFGYIIDNNKKGNTMRKFFVLLFIMSTLFSMVAVAQEHTRALSSKEIEQVKRHYKANGEQNVKTYLFSDLKRVPKGGKIKIGVLFEIKPGMNIYGPEKSSENLPTTLEWNLPEGFKLGRVLWQKVTSLAGGKNGYVGFCFVLAELQVTPDFSVSEAKILLKTSFQACDEMYCTPGEITNSLIFLVGKKENSNVEKIFKER